MATDIPNRSSSPVPPCGTSLAIWIHSAFPPSASSTVRWNMYAAPDPTSAAVSESPPCLCAPTSTYSPNNATDLPKSSPSRPSFGTSLASGRNVPAWDEWRYTIADPCVESSPWMPTTNVRSSTATLAPKNPPSLLPRCILSSLTIFPPPSNIGGYSTPFRLGQTNDGSWLGTRLELRLGRIDGRYVDHSVSNACMPTLGAWEGARDGISVVGAYVVGAYVVGSYVVGANDGVYVGVNVGENVGENVGAYVVGAGVMGASDVGTNVGSKVGSFVVGM
mmetsp:Transcript_23857/g.57526  ORF Transcript_23857/g.57526 Transcript_23857/m.57526 type:complete len:277 (+) Transcript_23857:954-1784(+)